MDWKVLMKAVEELTKLKRVEICSATKTRSIVLAKEALILIGRELGASNADMARLIGLDGSVVDDMNRQRAMDIDPTSRSLKDLTLILPYLGFKPDEWFSAHQKVASGVGHPTPWYYLRKGRLDDARKAIAERLPLDPGNYDLLMQQALLFALKGDFREAEARVPRVLAGIRLTDQARHHSTYDAACIYALAGKSREAVRWLRETAATGFPNYPLFERDPYLDRIRLAPEFVHFMTDKKTQWEEYRWEFGE